MCDSWDLNARARAASRPTYLVCWTWRVFLPPGRRAPRPGPPTTTVPFLRVRKTSWRWRALEMTWEELEENLLFEIRSRAKTEMTIRYIHDSYKVTILRAQRRDRRTRRTGASRRRWDTRRGMNFQKWDFKRGKKYNLLHARSLRPVRLWASECPVPGRRSAISIPAGRLGTAYACERRDLDNNRVSVARARNWRDARASSRMFRGKQQFSLRSLLSVAIVSGNKTMI